MKIALYQMKMSADMERNKTKSLQAIERAAGAGADLILFPEIQYCPFFPQYRKQNVSAYAMTPEDPFVLKIQESCRKNKIMAAPNIFLLENGKTYDATLLIDAEGEILGLQKMVHIAQARGYYEQDYYTPSEEGFRVFDTELGKIGVVVCYDRHYTESIRTETVLGADLILIPTANTVCEPSEMFEWEVRVQAFQNSVAIAMCNRTGEEETMEFSGESLVVGPDGDVVVKAESEEQLVYAKIDLEEVRRIRAGKTYTQLRRTEVYR